MVAVKRDVLGAVNARFDFGSPRPFDCGTARYAVRGAHRPQVKPGGQPPTSGRLGGDGSHRRAPISRRPAPAPHQERVVCGVRRIEPRSLELVGL